MKNRHSKRLADIRSQAEELVARRPQDDLESSPEDVRRLLHELRVHQTELEIQNEELRRAQLELEESRNKYLDLYDFSPIGHLTIDHHGLIVEANLKVADMLQVHRGHLIGRHFSNFILKDDHSVYYDHLRRTLESAMLQTCELRLKPKNGEAFDVQLQSLADAEPGDEPRRFRVAIVDIVERKQAERRQREYAENLHEEARRKDEFLAMLAHELRNPLAPIRNAGHLLRALRGLDPRLGQLQEMIERQVGHMARLLDDLLDVSRITRGKIQLRRDTLDLRNVIDAAVEAGEPALEARSHELHYERSAEPVWVEGDPTRLEQIVSNLLNNAVKYTEPCGTIRVSIGRERLRWNPETEAAIVRVRDNGLGIAPETLPRIFDLFAQAERSLDRSQGGLGIGLTLVRSLVELHGGQVCAHSAGLGQGSEFAVMLPLAQAPTEELPCADAADPKRAAKGTGDAEPDKKFKVLVVDDVADNAHSMAELLDQWGHQTALAFDGPAAMREAARFQPQIVLLDIGLPGEDGYAVARQLRQWENADQMLLIALTGYGREDDIRRSQAAGFNQHLTKPVDLDVLQGILHQFAAGTLP